eukprot:3166351-Pleurochrysis_carterae.AAC.1
MAGRRFLVDSRKACRSCLSYLMRQAALIFKLAQLQQVITGAGSRADAQQIILLLTDGEQTIDGDDNTAIAQAAHVKSQARGEIHWLRARPVDFRSWVWNGKGRHVGRHRF